MKGPFRAIQTTYLALLGGQLIFAFIVYQVLKRGGLPNNLDYPFEWITPLLTFGGLGIAYLLHRQRQKQARTLSFGLSRKVIHYKTSVLMRSAIIEGVNLFPLLAAFVENSLHYMVYFAVGLGLYLFLYPSKQHFIHYYNIDPGQAAQLR